MSGLGELCLEGMHGMLEVLQDALVDSPFGGGKGWGEVGVDRVFGACEAGLHCLDGLLHFLEHGLIFRLRTLLCTGGDLEGLGEVVFVLCLSELGLQSVDSLLHVFEQAPWSTVGYDRCGWDTFDGFHFQGLGR